MEDVKQRVQTLSVAKLGIEGPHSETSRGRSGEGGGGRFQVGSVQNRVGGGKPSSAVKLECFEPL